jgi:predicted type IV restriction endonuclease
MDVKQLTELAALDLTTLVQSENNVKYKIVIPFLQSFGHEHIDLEHAAQGSRIDINIGNKIVIETKALNQHIENHVQQLSDYCGREWPVLAILTNGKSFRIYSPQWRRQPTFRDKIIYAFDITDLTNAQLQERLKKVLGRDNYDTEAFYDHISQREKELLEAGRNIDALRAEKSGSVTQLRNEIETLKEQIRELNNQLARKEQTIVEIESQKVPEIDLLISELFIPRVIAASETQSSRPVEPFRPREIRGKASFPRGCTVDGVHYDSASHAINGLISAGKIRKDDIPTSSYNAHLWLRQNNSRFVFKYERDVS